MPNEEQLRFLFGQNVRTFRLEAGFTQGELGARTGLGKATIGHLERGTRAPSFESVAKIADALSIGVDSLFTEGGTPESCVPLISNAARALELEGHTDAMKSFANFLTALSKSRRKDVSPP